MSDNNDDHKEQRIGLWLAGSAAGLAVFLTLIWSVWGWENGKIEGSPNYGVEAASEAAVGGDAADDMAASAEQDGSTAANTENDTAADEHGSADTGNDNAASAEAENGTADNAAQDNAAADDDGAKVVVADNGAVKFYFATGKADLAAGAEEALQAVLAGVKEGKKAVVSGYHDKTGNAQLNEELSKKRAFSVRDALLGFGVPESQIELRKPEDSDAGEGAEARRVEVVLE